MIDVLVIIREPGREKPMSTYRFQLPSLPRIGDYLSICGPDIRPPFGEDVIVKHIWWRLQHPSAGATIYDDTAIGRVEEIFVECDIAQGPYASSTWKKQAATARAKGVEVEEFGISRISIAQDNDELES